MFSQHPKLIQFCAGKLIERVFYCFYEITIENVCQREKNLLYFRHQVAYSHQIHEMTRQKNGQREKREKIFLYFRHQVAYSHQIYEMTQQNNRQREKNYCNFLIKLPFSLFTSNS